MNLPFGVAAQVPGRPLVGLGFFELDPDPLAEEDFLAFLGVMGGGEDDSSLTRVEESEWTDSLAARLGMVAVY